MKSAHKQTSIMTPRSARNVKRKSIPGPKPEVLKIDGDWRDAIKKSLAKKKPLNGWPK